MGKTILLALKARGIETWASEDETFLRENYLKLFDKDLGAKLGRSADAVAAMRRRLGLIRMGKRLPKTCPVCGSVFYSQRRAGKYCSAKCRIAFYRSEWTRGQIGLNDQGTIDVEGRVASEILPRHGFQDILWTRPHTATFPFDILARRDGGVCAVEVTEKAQRSIHKGARRIAEYLGWTVFVCHIKRDGRYVLNRLNRSYWYSSALKWHPQNRDYIKPFERIYP